MATAARPDHYVDDLIEAFIRLMQTEEGYIGPVNTGNPGEFTIKQLAETVIRLTGSKSTIEYRPLPLDDPKQRQPDIALAREKLPTGKFRFSHTLQDIETLNRKALD